MLPRLQAVHRPETMGEALDLLAQPGVRVMALYGGPELFDKLEAAAEMEEVVSLAALGLERVIETAEGVRIGAMAPLTALPAGDLAGAAARSYPLNLRAMWTVGAVAAHGGASSPLLATLLALDARVELAGEQTLPLADYLPQRAPTDLITAVIVPGDSRGALAFEAVARTPSDEPIVCAAARVAVVGGSFESAALALGGAAITAIRAREVEAALTGRPAAREAVESAVEALGALNPPADFRGSSAYRREMAKVTARRALLRAMEAGQAPA